MSEITGSPGAAAESMDARVFKVCGLSETELSELLAPVDLGQNAGFSIIDRYPDLTLRLVVQKGDEEKLSRLGEQVRATLGYRVYAEGERTLEEVVGELLLARRMTLALAESCTGGYISHRVTRVAGSSAYYYGGAVTYSNEAKILFLGVKPETLQRHGAVSRETALEMSQGIRARTGVSIGLSVTGVAGPSGGSAEKPVGTVWISIEREAYHEARRFQFHGERERIILGTSQTALDWLRRCLL
ncbi:MAG TPA: nicotinamide-nucleotide amidohydrolase family protein [Candidatus Binatia bacterium]